MADFTPSIVTPNLQGYTGQEPFRFWCQMALPLVYDDTLSYYELLNKVVVYLNNTISDVATAEENIEAINNATNTNIAALLQSYRQLQEYVNDYFTNLDVQQEINTKLDDMATSGELSNLLSPFIPDLVTNWLTANVNPVGSAVVVDSSLSVSGAAADAKITGEKILANTDNCVSISDGKALFTGDFTLGTIRESDGEIISGYNYRIVSPTYYSFDRDIFVRLSQGYIARVAFYNENNVFQNMTGASYTSVLGIPASQHFRITIRRVEETTSESANIEEFRKKCFYETTPQKTSNDNSDVLRALMNYTDEINPDISDYTDSVLINANGARVTFDGYFSNTEFIELPYYCSSVTFIYFGSNAYLAEYAAPNENSFVQRQQLTNGIITTSAKYFRICCAGSISDNYSDIYFIPKMANGDADFHSFVKSIKNGTNKTTLARCNIFTESNIKYNNEVLLTNDDVKTGDTIYYKFSTKLVGFLDVLNTNGVRIRTIGKTSSSVPETQYQGSYIIPDTFGRIVVSRSIKLDYLYGDSAEQKQNEYNRTNNTNKGFINGTATRATGAIQILGYSHRIVKRDINYTSTPIYITCNNDNYRFIVVTYDINENLISYGNDVKRATIPSNTYYRIVVRLADETGASAADIETFENVLSFDCNIINAYPLETMPKYIRGCLSYRPLGRLSKPYICFSTDDGRKQLATYTLPLFISKNVPLTMCIWSTSDVMQNAVGRAQILAATTNPGTARYITITTDPDTQAEIWNEGSVINSNYDNTLYPNIAQHGSYPWANGSQMDTPYDEKQLFDFFESEKNAFTNYGLTVSRAAACPYGYTDERMIAETGGYFGVNRSVYNPNDNNIVYYPFYSSGERSNIFALRACNIKGYSTPTWENAVDYIKANNMLLCIYLHDWDLSTTARDDGITDDGDGTSHTAAKRLEDLIDYAKAQNITFINLSDIPNLSAAQGFI